MSQHATAQNLSNLAAICTDTANSVAKSLADISVQTFSITDPPLLDATFSDLASRVDDLSRMADQFENLHNAIDRALNPPTTTTPQ